MDAIASRFIGLRNQGFFLSPKDESAIERICQLPLKTEQLQFMLEEIFYEYHLKNPNGRLAAQCIVKR